MSNPALSGVEDTQESKFQGAYGLAGTGTQNGVAVYTISHRRSDILPTYRTLPELVNSGTLVVSEEEEIDYRMAWPDADILTIPAGWAGFPGGVGRARQFVLDTARELGQRNIVLLDDDLESLSVLYSIGLGKVSHAFARLVGDRREEFMSGLLALSVEVALEAFEENPRAVIASPQCNNANRTPASARVKWEVNRGGPPAQVQIWDVERFYEAMPEGLNLPDFNWHGDDIGLLADLLHRGWDVVNIPSVIGQYLDYETKSVIRNPETAPALRATEHEALMRHPMAKFIKTRTDLLGEPQWHAIDWRKLAGSRELNQNSSDWEPDLDLL